MRVIRKDDHEVRFDDSQEVKDKVFEKLIDFFKEHETYSGESICQSDGPQVEAPELLSTIADDIIKFRVKWN